MIKKFKIRLEFLFLILFIILVSGCLPNRNSGSSKDFAKGSDGLSINFLENNPLDSYLVDEEEEPITLILEIKNQGAFPDENDLNILDTGQVYISGYDEEIINFDDKSKNLDPEFLLGKSSSNPEGGYDTINFDGSIIADNMIVSRYEPTLLATICYPYVTRVSTSVCVDPFPTEDRGKKVCNLGSQRLTSQGAPIAITRIDQEASSNKIQFKISLKNIGDGEIIKFNELDKCDPHGGERLEADEFDRVQLVRATVSPTELRCGPFVEGSNIRLVDGEGFVICSLDINDLENIDSAYVTPLNLEFRYGYRTTTSKSIIISKINSIS